MLRWDVKCFVDALDAETEIVGSQNESSSFSVKYFAEL